MKISTLKQGVVGGIIALSLVGIIIPTPRAEAATMAELQAQIQTLLAQIVQLQNQLRVMQGGGTICVVPQSDLSMGSHGSDVTTLQNFLIGRGYSIPAGATGYFGSQTQNALRLFQSNQGISPALGYNYGTQTRARIQALCAPAPSPTPQPTPTPQPEPEPPLSGEVSLERFSVQDGNDTDLEEGDKEAEIMEVSFKVEDGDAKINRIDLGFHPDSGNNENDPWDVFTTVSVWSGSKQIATIDASRERNWKEDSPATDDYLLRMSGLDYVVREGRELNLTVKVTVAKSVKGTNDGELWNVFVPDNGIRALDADNAVVYTGDTADAVTINIDRAGASDELLVRRSDEDPDAGTLQVKDDARSGYLEVFAFDLDTDDSKNDIEVNRLPVQLTVSTSTLDSFMRDIRLSIDGKDYTRKTVVDGSTGVVTFEFRSGELTINDGERVTVKVEIDFKALPVAYEGATIVGRIDADDIDAEGEDDLSTTQLQGAATGELHTLYTKGSDAKAGGTEAEVTSLTGTNNDYATFQVTVDLTAFGQDVYLPANTGAVTYEIQNASGNDVGSLGSAVVSSDAREQGGYFFIPEGSTRSLTLRAVYSPGTPMTAVRMQLLSVNFNDTMDTPDQTWSALPASSYRTPTVIIVD